MAYSVLHVGKFFPPFSGGMENFLADLLTAQSRQGLKVSAVVHDHRPGTRGEVSAWPAPGNGAARAADESAKVPVYRAPARGRLLYAPVSPRFPLWLRRAMRTERPDILHLHVPNTSAFWVLTLPEARRVPWVVHWHADVVSSGLDRRLKLAYPLYRPFEQRLLRGTRKVIVTSPAYLEGSRALARWHDKCCVIPLGLDAARLPDTPSSARRLVEGRWGDAGFRILSVGRLTYYKGHEHLVRAMDDLPGARALIVGTGERRPVLERLIAGLGLGERVALTGSLAPEELHALMAGCDCFCLPSIERTEAFGMVLLEAMAHGKASVVCDIPGSGVGWVVRDGDTGRVVAPSSPGALSAALRSLSQDRRTLRAMGIAARKRYDEWFPIERVSNQISGLYRGLAEQALREPS